MMEVYDRVLPSRSIPTLVGLSAIILGAVRSSRACSTCSAAASSPASAPRSTRTLSQRVFRLAGAPAAQGRADRDGLQPLRDLDQIRAFLAGGGPAALFDLPWIPLYLFICFLFHPLIG